jgi:hypothetical protein
VIERDDVIVVPRFKKVECCGDADDELVMMMTSNWPWIVLPLTAIAMGANGNVVEFTVVDDSGLERDADRRILCCCFCVTVAMPSSSCCSCCCCCSCCHRAAVSGAVVL